MEKIIEEYYYDPETGFASAKDLYRKLIADGHYVTLKRVQDFVVKQETAQINKETIKPKLYNTNSITVNT